MVYSLKMKISHQIISQIYYQILRIRKIESKISEEYSEWKMRCPVHLSIGQESIAAPLSVLFRNKIYEVLSSHRAHAHYLGKGATYLNLFLKLWENQQVVVEERGVNAFDRYRCWFFIKYRNSS